MDKSFEQAYKRLEEIVSLLQSEELDVDKSISLFKEGIELKNYCNGILKDANKQVIEILEQQELESEQNEDI